MPKYEVTMRFLCEDKAVVNATNKQEAVERASDAVMGGGMLPGDPPDWLVKVLASSEVVEHYRPKVRRI